MARPMPKVACVGCGTAFAPLACDFEVAPGRTCDALICKNCAQRKRRYPEGTICVTVRGPHGSYNAANDTIDYCPTHHQTVVTESDTDEMEVPHGLAALGSVQDQDK